MMSLRIIFFCFLEAIPFVLIFGPNISDAPSLGTRHADQWHLATQKVIFMNFPAIQLMSHQLVMVT